jgi:N-dimethylarginine dimethylaminohydrolase
MLSSFGSQSMVSPLRTVVVKRPEDGFGSASNIEKQWHQLNYLRPPDPVISSRQHHDFVSLLEAAGAVVLFLPADDRTGLDSVYTHDPVLITNHGAVILQTGKPARRGEGLAFSEALQGWNVPILGVVEGDATAEAGDMVWLDEATLVVGRGFRTNAAGVHALRRILGPVGIEVLEMHLPCWNGQQDVLHLMSFISMLDHDLAVVYRRLMPVPLLELLNERRVQLVDIPDEEFATLGCNVLAVSPRRLIMVSGNPMTRARLQTAGCAVAEFDGSEICIPGSGGPTCLTRPLLRA